MEINSVQIDSVLQDPSNARAHDERNLRAIQASLLKFGQQRPIVVDGKGVILAGNGTWAAARALGWTMIDVVRTDLTGVEAVAYAIADNRTAELASWDEPALAKLLKELLADETFDHTVAGFSDEEIAELINRVESPDDGVVEDEIPLPPDEATTQPGDLWVLGEHRLLCGDSSRPEDLDRLLDGHVIHLVSTDPPYNVRVEPRSNNAIAAGLSSFQATNTKPQNHHQSFDTARLGPRKATHGKLRAKDRPLANDFVSDEDFDEMLDAWFGNASRVLVPGGSFYIWGGYANLGNYPGPLKRAGLYFSQGIVWDKMHPVLTRKDLMGAYEICFYGWKEGAGHKFYGPNNATDLWHIKKVNPQSMIHLTEKPVELAVRAIQYSSLPGQNVLDLFGGSGSTLMGCEQTGRRAYLMELDPLYCDVIVQRWEKFTGRKAERIAAAAHVAVPAPTGKPSRKGRAAKAAPIDPIPDPALVQAGGE